MFRRSEVSRRCFRSLYFLRQSFSIRLLCILGNFLEIFGSYNFRVKNIFLGLCILEGFPYVYHKRVCTGRYSRQFSRDLFIREGFLFDCFFLKVVLKMTSPDVIPSG